MSLSKYILTVVASACLISGHVSSVFAHNGEKHNSEKIQKKLSAQGKRVVSLLENYATAVQSGKLQEIEKYIVMNDSFSSLNGTIEYLGWESYSHKLASELPNFSNISYKITNIRPYVKGKLAYAVFDYALHIALKNTKKPLDISGKATFILVRVNKEWKIRHMHTTPVKMKSSTPEKNHH